MAVLFPNGLRVDSHPSARDWNRLHLLVQIVVKLNRYAANFNRGGHADSLRDLAVYAAMLESLDGLPPS